MMRGIRLCGQKVAERLADAGCRLWVLASDQPSIDDNLDRPVCGRMVMCTAGGKRAGQQEGNRLGQLDGPFLVVGKGGDILAGNQVRAVAQCDVDQCRGAVAHGGDDAAIAPTVI